MQNGRKALGQIKTDFVKKNQTRITWENRVYEFEDNDQFGAGVTDAAKHGEVSNGSLQGNYIFTKNGEEYTTTSQMFEGNYMFYNYKGFQKKNTRDLISFDLTVPQVADLDNPSAAILENQIFFSPIYDIAAENTTEENNIALPLRFTPFFATVAFPLVNNLDEPVVIKQIILEGKFEAAAGQVDQAAIKTAKMHYGVRMNDAETEYIGDKYELLGLKYDGDKVNSDAKVEAEYEKAYKSADFSKDEVEANNLRLDCQDYVLGAGKEITAYMLVPVEAHSGNLQILVEVVAGGETKMFMAGTMTNPSFDRISTKAAFGIKSDNTPRTVAIVESKLAAVTKYYVRDKAELIETIASHREDITVDVPSSVKIDADILEAIDVANHGVKFVNDVTIKADGEDVELSSLISFAKDIKVTFEKGKSLSIDNNCTYDVDWDVKEGTVTIDDANLSSKGITVAGNLTIKGDAKNVGNVTVSGTLNVEKADAGYGTITMNSGTLNLKAANVVATKIDMKGGTLNIANNAQTVATGKIADLAFVSGTTLNIEGTSSNPASLTVTGETVNMVSGTNAYLKNAYATFATGTNGVINLNGKVENKGVVNGSTGKITNTGTVDNHKTITSIDNEGFVVMKDAWESRVTTIDHDSDGKKGWIDNTAQVTLATDENKKNYIYALYSGSVDKILTHNDADYVVLNGCNLSDNVAYKIPAGQTVIMLGNNNMGTIGVGTFNLSTASSGVNGTVCIGIPTGSSATDVLAQDLSKHVLGTFTGTGNTVAERNAVMTTTLNSGELKVTNLVLYGKTNRTRGKVIWSTLTDTNSYGWTVATGGEARVSAGGW